MYEADNHCILNKWLLLSNAEDANAGAKGYILACMSVLSQGDEATVSLSCIYIFTFSYIGFEALHGEVSIYVTHSVKMSQM